MTDKQYHKCTGYYLCDTSLILFFYITASNNMELKADGGQHTSSRDLESAMVTMYSEGPTKARQRLSLLTVRVSGARSVPRANTLSSKLGSDWIKQYFLRDGLVFLKTWIVWGASAYLVYTQQTESIRVCWGPYYTAECQITVTALLCSSAGSMQHIQVEILFFLTKDLLFFRWEFL